MIVQMYGLKYLMFITKMIENIGYMFFHASLSSLYHLDILAYHVISDQKKKKKGNIDICNIYTV